LYKMIRARHGLLCPGTRLSLATALCHYAATSLSSFFLSLPCFSSTFSVFLILPPYSLLSPSLYISFCISVSFCPFSLFHSVAQWMQGLSVGSQIQVGVRTGLVICGVLPNYTSTDSEMVCSSNQTIDTFPWFCCFRRRVTVFKTRLEFT
jgi:hypothetical protein